MRQWAAATWQLVESAPTCALLRSLDPSVLSTLESSGDLSGDGRLSRCLHVLKSLWDVCLLPCHARTPSGATRGTSKESRNKTKKQNKKNYRSALRPSARQRRRGSSERRGRRTYCRLPRPRQMAAQAQARTPTSYFRHRAQRRRSGRAPTRALWERSARAGSCGKEICEYVMYEYMNILYINVRGFGMAVRFKFKSG
ncbi:hypothetical protein T492DRAFT_136862 [Pavlovales sp. CCMP2436]|nr:hypothetical protein T492DRAFT_136862 [Pavlovales sp. CCMP2436]